jgi:hypothetical protein
MPPIPPPQPLPSIAVNPQPQPQPQTTIVQPPVSGASLNAKLVLAALAIMAVTALAGLAMIIAAVVYFGGRWPAPSPVAVDFKALGQEYAKALGPSYAPAWKGYAADLRAGKPMADATKAANDLWAKNRDAIFKAKLQPALSGVIPDGTADDKITPTQRAAMAAAAEDLAEGLEKGP